MNGGFHPYSLVPANGQLAKAQNSRAGKTSGCQTLVASFVMFLAGKYYTLG